MTTEEIRDRLREALDAWPDVRVTAPVGPSGIAVSFADGTTAAITATVRRAETTEGGTGDDLA